AGGVRAGVRVLSRAAMAEACYAVATGFVGGYPAELPVLAALLPDIATPVTLINGRHDRVVPLANAEFLDQRLPNSRLAVIDAGHFVWEEAPAEYASIVIDAVTHASTNGGSAP